MNRKKLTDRQAFYIVWLTGLAALFLPILLMEASILRYTHGVFMYPFDDTFIHIEMSRKLATEGVWGINDHQFGAASSSLLYTLILSLFHFISAGTFMPFVINCLAGALLTWVLSDWLQKQGLRPWAQVLIMLGAIFLTPLATLVISGMEHSLQTLFCFLFLIRFSSWLEESLAGRASRRLPWSLVGYAVLVTAIRYEGLFLVAVAGLLLLYYKNARGGVKMVLFSLVPVLVFGFYSLSRGGYFLPNSILIKSGTLNTGGAWGFLSNILFEKLTYARNGMGALATQRLLIILPLVFLLFRKYMVPSYKFFLLLLMGTTFLHLALAATGTLYRYEAYLFFSSVVILGLLVFKYGRMWFAGQSWQWKTVSLALALFLLFPVLLRGLTALDKTRQGAINIYEQQYQMGQFSHRFYNRDTIAANDIGAIAYFTEANIVDLWGLATTEVARSKKKGYWTPGFLDSLSRKNHVSVAMIYDSWFSDDLVRRWKKAASWQIQNNVICGDDTVSFYAVDSTDYPVLLQHLKTFEASLPSTVRVRYY
ncbi:MAG: hypothetical protein ACXVMS_09130 [Flavisolibacter sp.]